MMSKLRTIEQLLASANNQLNAFVDEVTALKQSGALDAATADALIALARALQNGLQ